MKYIIYKNQHRAWPPRWDFFFKRKRVAFDFAFHQDCKYDIGPDQDDANKLFGLGFYPWWKFILMCLGSAFGLLLIDEHHEDSIRFGWSYNKTSGNFLIWAYAYVRGSRVEVPMIEVLVDVKYRGEIVTLDDRYMLILSVKETGEIMKTVEISKYHHKPASFLLWLYFGGNRSAPHSMTVEINKP